MLPGVRSSESRHRACLGARPPLPEQPKRGPPPAGDDLALIRPALCLLALTGGSLRTGGLSDPPLFPGS